MFHVEHIGIGNRILGFEKSWEPGSGDNYTNLHRAAGQLDMFHVEQIELR